MNRHCGSTPPSTASSRHYAPKARPSPGPPHRKPGTQPDRSRNQASAQGPPQWKTPQWKPPPRKETSQSGRIPASRSQGRLPGPEPATRPTWHGIPSDQLQERLAPDQTLSITLGQLRVLGQSASTYIIADHPHGETYQATNRSNIVERIQLSLGRHSRLAGNITPADGVRQKGEGCDHRKATESAVEATGDLRQAMGAGRDHAIPAVAQTTLTESARGRNPLRPQRRSP